MGTGKYDNKYGVGILLIKKWRQRIVDTEYVNERSIIATIVVNHQRIKLMSAYFTPSGCADHHIEKCTKRSRSTRQIAKHTYISLKETSMQNWDLVTEPNAFVLADTNSTRETKRGDWMKQWLMLQGYTALDTMYRKNTSETNDLQRSPKGNEKQIDFLLTKRRYLRYNKDAEANDVIHMGSDTDVS